MDKYEYRVRAEEINSLIEQKEYAQAVKIVDEIDWRRVKSITMLIKVSELYKMNRRYEDSKEILLLADQRMPDSRKIIYSLCELSIKLEELVPAIEYYKKFVQIAPRDTGKFILQYRLYEAQDVSLEERIAVLEEYKKRDYREKWAYELAYLYHRIGLATRCVEECDELILWFGEGKYVIKAMELKMLHAPLTKTQQEKYDQRFESDDKAFIVNTEGEARETAAPVEDVKDQATRPISVNVPAANIPTHSAVAMETIPSMPIQIKSVEVSNAPTARIPAKVVKEKAQDEEISIDMPEIPVSNEHKDQDIEVKTLDMGRFNTINLQKELAKNLAAVMQEEDMGASDATRALPIDSIQDLSGNVGEIAEEKGVSLDTTLTKDVIAQVLKKLGEDENQPISEEDLIQSMDAPAEEAVVETLEEETTEEVVEEEPVEVPVVEETVEEPVAEAVEEEATEEVVEEETVEAPAVEETVEEPVAEAVEEETAEEVAEEETVEVPAIEEIAEEPIAEAVEEEATEEVVEEEAVEVPAVEEIAEEPVAEAVEEETAEEVVEEETVEAPAVEEIAEEPVAEAVEEETAEEVVVEETVEAPAVEEIAEEAVAETVEEETAEEVVEEETVEAPAVEEIAEEAVAETVEEETAEEVVEEETVEVPVVEEIAEEPVAETVEETVEEAPVVEAIATPVATSAEEVEESPENKQITGQLSFADILAGWEETKKATEEKHIEEMRQKVLAQTGPMFHEFDEATKASVQADLNLLGPSIDVFDKAQEAEKTLEAMDVLDEVEELEEIKEMDELDDVVVEEAPKEMEAHPTTFNTAEINSLEAKLMMNAIDPDKEPAAPVVEEVVAPVVEEVVAPVVETPVIETPAEPVDPALVVEEPDAPAPAKPVLTTTQEIEAIIAEAEESVKPINPDEAFDASLEQAILDALSEPEGEEAATSDVAKTGFIVSDLSQPEKPMTKEEAIIAKLMAKEQAEKEAKKVEEAEKAAKAAEQAALTGDTILERRALTRDEKEMFGSIAQTKEVQEEVANAIDNVSLNPCFGNIIISGDKGTGTLTVAKNLIKVLAVKDKAFSNKVAKVTGETLNSKKVEDIVASLNNGALIVEEAGDLNDATLAALGEALRTKTGTGILVVFEDTNADVENLLINENMPKDLFNLRINIEALDNDGLVAYGKEYANEQEYSIDDMGVLALYTRISERQTRDHAVTVEEVRGIIDEAIKNAEKKNVAHFMDVILAKRYDDDDMIVLREKDFL